MLTHVTDHGKVSTEILPLSLNVAEEIDTRWPLADMIRSRFTSRYSLGETLEVEGGYVGERATGEAISHRPDNSNESANGTVSPTVPSIPTVPVAPYRLIKQASYTHSERDRRRESEIDFGHLISEVVEGDGRPASQPATSEYAPHRRNNTCEAGNDGASTVGANSLAIRIPPYPLISKIPTTDTTKDQTGGKRKRNAANKPGPDKVERSRKDKDNGSALTEREAKPSAVKSKTKEKAKDKQTPQDEPSTRENAPAPMSSKRPKHRPEGGHPEPVEFSVFRQGRKMYFPLDLPSVTVRTVTDSNSNTLTEIKLTETNGAAKHRHDSYTTSKPNLYHFLGERCTYSVQRYDVSGGRSYFLAFDAKGRPVNIYPIMHVSKTNNSYNNETLKRSRSINKKESDLSTLYSFADSAYFSYQNGMPSHIAYPDQSVFHVMSEQEYRTKSISTVQGLLSTGNIILHSCGFPLLTFDRKGLSTLRNVSNTIKLRGERFKAGNGSLLNNNNTIDFSMDCDIDGTYPLREGTVDDLLKSAESPAGKILQAPRMPMKWASWDLAAYSSDIAAWRATMGTAYAKDDIAIPTGHFLYASVSNKGAVDWWQIAPDGLGLSIEVVCGSYIIFVAKPKLRGRAIKPEDFEDFADIKLFAAEVFDPTRPTSPHWQLEAMYLPAGTQM